MDTRTLTIVLAITNAIQFAMLLFQYRTNPKYSGLGMWPLGMATLGIGFAIGALRSASWMGHTAIVVSMVLLISGLILLYVGFVRFFGGTENRKVLSGVLGGFAAAMILLTFPVDSFQFRRSIFFLLAALVLAACVRVLAMMTNTAMAAASRLLIVVIGAGSLGLAILSVAELAGVESGGTMYHNSPAFVAGYLFALVCPLLGTFGMILLVSQRLRADLRAEHENLQRIFQTSPDATAISRLSDGVFVDINQGFTELTGYTRTEALGTSAIGIRLWNDPVDRARLVEALTSAGACEGLEASFRHKDGSIHAGVVSARVLDLAGSPHLISVTQDVTERKALEEELRRRASTDDLTGIYNRRCFLELADRELRRAARTKEPLTIALLDIDHLKPFNDTFGHGAGDIAIAGFAQSCRSNLREVDLMARIGGDEFAVLMPNTNTTTARTIITRLQTGLTGSRGSSGSAMPPLTFSAGLALFEESADDLDSLLSRADAAMYRAKDLGRDRIDHQQP